MDSGSKKIRGKRNVKVKKGKKESTGRGRYGEETG